MKWETVELKDICKIKSGKRLPKGSKFSEVITPYPYIRARDIKNGVIDSDNLVYITENDKKNIFKYIVNTNDIVITIVGASVGDVAYVKKELDGFNLTENAVRLTEFLPSVNAHFVFNVLNTDIYWNLMQQIAGGSAQPKLGIYKIESISINLPPLSTQNKIVAILSAYDDLIENNQKQIKLLEEAAQRLYKEWFVDLRFPGYEQTKIINGVPEGWENNILSDIADISMGQSPKSEFYNDKKDGLPFHQGVGSYGNRFVIDNVYTTSYTRIAEPDSILFSVRAPVGRLNRTKNRIVIGRGLSAINHKKGFQSYLFYLLKNKFFKDNILGNGSIFASISKDELANQKLIVPTDSLVERFNSQVKSIDDKIDILDSQNELLKEIRDRLLPKLMSGEIEV